MCKVLPRYIDDLGGRGGQRRAQRTEEEDTDLKPNLVNLAPAHPREVSSPPTVWLCVHACVRGGGGEGEETSRKHSSFHFLLSLPKLELVVHMATQS